MTVDLQSAKSHFAEIYGADPAFIARAPGRVNIIGEHTDYNHGFVLPMAIERETVILVQPRNDMKLQAYAHNLGRRAMGDLEHRLRNEHEPWLDYVIGVADELAKLGLPLHGANIMIMGDVPIGAGLSSSASLEMAALVMFETMGQFTLDGPEAPKLGRRVENHFLGVNSGIMDQFIVRMGKDRHALFLDCRSMEYELVPVAFKDAKFVIADTCKSRGLADSKYNERVDECGAAVRALREGNGNGGTHLRDFDLDQLEQYKDRMSETVYRRARHVISEDERTKAACAAMRDGDIAGLGKLMNESDHSLRDDYAVTCAELDAMTSIARSIDGCYGARMTGAGFGGCTVNLVEAGSVDAFTKNLLARYQDETGLEGKVIISEPSAGARLDRG